MRWKNPATWAAVLLTVGIAMAARLRVSHIARSVPVPATLHVVVHITLFALLTVLLFFSAGSWSRRVLLLAGVLLFGFWTEYYEHVRDGFPIEQPDVVADSLGVGLGALLGLGVLAIPRRELPDDVA